jgi:polysaccharide biosynthesis/export protein
MLSRRMSLTLLIIPAMLLAQKAENPQSKTFVVAGKVKHPGKFELRDGMHVMDAIIKAGGFADFFNRKKITITRDGEQHNFNYSDFIHGRNVEQNILMQNGDVVDVP